jgi:predicted secreted protein
MSDDTIQIHASFIHLQYLKGIVPEDRLEYLRSQREPCGISFEWHAISDEPQSSVEELLSPILLYLASATVQAYLLGIATSASCDVFKSSVVDLYRPVSGKTRARFPRLNSIVICIEGCYVKN